MILLGDALLYVLKNRPKLGSVVKISQGGKKLKMLKGVELQTENVLISLKELKLEDTGSKLIYLHR